MKWEYRDGLEYKDPKTGNRLIFNSLAWVTLIEGIIMNFTDTEQMKAKELINSWFVFPENYWGVIYYSHELEYHWAMQIVYGEGYWLRGVSSIEPENYFEWQNIFMKKNNIKKEPFEFIDV